MDGVDGRNLVHKILEEKQKSCKFSKMHSIAIHFLITRIVDTLAKQGYLPRKSRLNGHFKSEV